MSDIGLALTLFCEPMSNKEIIYQAPWGQVWAEQYAHQYYTVVYGT